MKTKINEILDQYPVLTEAEIKKDILNILEKRSPENSNADVYAKILSMIDLTSLNTADTVESIEKFTEKVNSFSDKYPELENVAAICVYPSMVKTVRETLTEGVDIASVSGGFPHSQTFIEVKIAETSLAVLDGASEIDIVIPVGKLLERKYEEIIEEIKEIKSACRDAKLKVILESGALNLHDLRVACILAMESGADFIKTSTGKQQPAATPLAAYYMCTMIAKYHELTGKKVGFKAAGGISTPDEAIQYYCIVESILGKEWLDKEYFRFGASRLANAVLSEILGEKTEHF